MARSDITTRPWCPFCGQTIAKPQDPEQRKLGEFTMGRCTCGAVYACDPTGHNVGAAMVEALVHSCNDDWDLAWSLLPEDDYLTGRIENYDEQTNQVISAGNMDGRTVRGVLYFVRLHKEIAIVTESVHGRQTVPSLNAEAPFISPPMEPERDPNRVKKRATKSLVEQMMHDGAMDNLVDLTFDDPRTIRFIQRILYTPDEKKRWRTAHLLGGICARIATRKPGQVSDLLHRLFAACSDSASANWGAVEAIGSIIGARPDIFGAFSRHLLPYLQHESTAPLVLWALGTIAKTRPDLIRELPFFTLFQYLSHPEPQYRGLTLRLLSRLKAREARSKIEALAHDSAVVMYYEDGTEVTKTVADLAGEALNRIDDGGNTTR